MKSDSLLPSDASIGRGLQAQSPLDRTNTDAIPAELAAKQPSIGTPTHVGKPPTATRSGWHYTFSSLANRDYRFLWLGTFFLMASFQMQGIAQGYLVYQITGSAKILGLVSAAAAVTMLALALVGGAIADRVDRKRLIQLCQGTTTLLALVVAVAIVTGALIWQHLLVIAMLQGVVWSFNGPARQALIPHVVERRRIGNAIALISLGMSAPALVAPAVAGLLYALAGPEAVYYAATGLGVLAVGCTTLIRTTAPATRATKTGVTADIKAGLGYLWTDQQVRILLAVGISFMLLASPILFLLPVLVVDVYQREAEALGLLVSMIGLGGLTGTILVASLGEGRRGLLLIGFGLATGIGLILTASIPVYLVGVGIMAIVGLGEAGLWSLVQVLVMSRVKDEYRGRVMSLIMMSFGLMPLAIVPAGVLADLVGAQIVIGVMGGTLLTVATLAALTQRSLRGMR